MHFYKVSKIVIVVKSGYYQHVLSINAIRPRCAIYKKSLKYKLRKFIQFFVNFEISDKLKFFIIDFNVISIDAFYGNFEQIAFK